MKALLKPDGGAGLELTDVPVPRPGAGEILVKVLAGGFAARICTSRIACRSNDSRRRSRY
jgi:D-arabinose 1-dehydrogenase-like Zn-dependent alcohol dehydrogenase